MRITDRTLYGTQTNRHVNHDGDTVFSSDQVVYSQTGTLSKSDIQRTKPDATGWRMPTSYSCSDTTIVYDVGTRAVRTVDQRPGILEGTSTVSWSGPCTWITGLQPVDWYPGEWFPLDPYGSLVNKALLKLRDQKINLALNAAEFSKTADGIARSLQRVTTSYRAFRRGDFKRSLSALGLTTRNRGKDAASTWLELQYGILPLMGDIKGAYDVLTSQVRQHGQRIRVMSRSAHSTGVTQDNLVTEVPYSTGNLRFEWSKKFQLILWFEVDNPELLAASSVGLTNPLEILWEITPWSFVIDWFLTVGDFLGAVTAAQGFKFLGGSFTTVTEQKNERWLTPIKAFETEPGVKVTPSFSGQRRTVVKEMERVPVLVSPPAQLPQFENPLSLKRVVNAVALLRTLR